MGMVATEPRLLFVDDEPNVTAGIQRTFFDEFDIDTAESGEEALQLMMSEGPYTVIVSDMRMPQMDGASLLARVRTMAPSTVRMLLTGYADIDAAVSAINDGHVFRMLCKPCPEDTLRDALLDGIRQHNLVMAEKQLLEDTLQGAVKVLVDVLSLAVPVAFARSNQLKACVTHLATELGIRDRWQLELAAMLSHLGYVAIPPEVVNKVAQGRELDTEEKKLVADHPQVGYQLLQKIPRLEGVATLVRGATSPGDTRACGPDLKRDVALLSLAMHLDRLVQEGLAFGEAITRLRATGKYDEAWLKALAGFEGAISGPRWVIKKLSVLELAPGMVLEEDVVSPSGGVLVPKGREINAPLVERLKNFARRRAVVQPITVATRQG